MAEKPKIIDAEFEVVEPAPSIKSILKGMIGPGIFLLFPFGRLWMADYGNWPISDRGGHAIAIVSTPAVILLGRQAWLLFRTWRERVQH